MTLELQPGDTILLCSDGLSGFVTDAAVKHVLLTRRPPDEQVRELVELANEAGGGDNITAVVLRFGAPPDEVVAAAEERVDRDTEPNPVGGDASEDEQEDDSGSREPVRVRTADDPDQQDWAQRLGRFGNRDTLDDRSGPRSNARRLMAIVAAVVLVLALVFAGGRWLLSRSYYVGIDGDSDTVAIYQGIPVDLGPLELSWIVERTRLHVDELPDYFVESLRDGIAAIDRRDARLIVENAPRRDEGEGEAEDPTEEPTPAPTAAPAAGTSPTP